ncbi:MAG: DUF350 domain-containing protein [Salinibacter sp.]|uniref:DUF350 domain-containing protein n=1 Tax=Salinibacter sp. TaxID=2065818 RepID=UPI0035D4A38F
MNLPTVSEATVQALVSGTCFVILFAVVFMIGRWANRMITSYDIEEVLTEEDNPALAVSLAGYYLGIVIIYVGALLGPSHGLQTDLLLVGGYALGGILLLLLSRYLNDKLILTGFSADKEILEDRNPGTGVVRFGSYVASALIVAGAVHGEGGGPHTALAFYALGQVALLLFLWLYDFMTPYSLQDQIEQDNFAAGIGFSGALVAIGLIIMRAVSGDFIGWVGNLRILGLNLLVIFVYLVGVRFFFDKMMIPESDLNVEIVRDRNVGAGLLEFAVSVGFSGVLFFVL